MEPVIYSDWFFLYISCYFVQLGHSYLASEKILTDLLKGTPLEFGVRGNCYFGENVYNSAERAVEIKSRPLADL